MKALNSLCVSNAVALSITEEIEDTHRDPRCTMLLSFFFNATFSSDCPVYKKIKQEDTALYDEIA